jgi:hypothetical protein
MRPNHIRDEKQIDSSSLVDDFLFCMGTERASGIVIVPDVVAYSLAKRRNGRPGPRKKKAGKGAGYI